MQGARQPKEVHPRLDLVLGFYKSGIVLICFSWVGWYDSYEISFVIVSEVCWVVCGVIIFL